MQSIERKSPLAYGAMGFIEMDINKNRSAASFYLKKAAEMGEAQAMHNYAHFLHTGGDDGNTPDIVSAPTSIFPPSITRRIHIIQNYKQYRCVEITVI